MKNIVILVGSPRPDGNTALLAQAFAEGAAQHCQVKIISIADLSIAPCRGCNACFANGHRCVQADDMQQVYDALAEADLLVVASPVYFYGISAQLAAVIHRLHNPLRDSFRIRQAVLLLASASSKPHVVEPIKLQYTLLLKNFDIQDCGMVIAQGVKAPGDIRRTDGLSRARQLGSTM